MESYFFDEEGIIKTELLEKAAEKEAQKFGALTTTQLINFFNEVKALEKRLKDNGDSDEHFKKIMPLIKMLKSKIVYASARQKNMGEFEEFIKDRIDKIKNKKDFK
ncbi:MAG: type III-A CRISPR-associated protein Csm2, partial [Candidatus Humimicrobiaceae bacterium]